MSICTADMAVHGPHNGLLHGSAAAPLQSDPRWHVLESSHPCPDLILQVPTYGQGHGGATRRCGAALVGGRLVGGQFNQMAAAAVRAALCSTRLPPLRLVGALTCDKQANGTRERWAASRSSAVARLPHPGQTLQATRRTACSPWRLHLATLPPWGSHILSRHSMAAHPRQPVTHSSPTLGISLTLGSSPTLARNSPTRGSSPTLVLPLLQAIRAGRPSTTTVVSACGPLASVACALGGGAAFAPLLLPVKGRAALPHH